MVFGIWRRKPLDSGALSCVLCCAVGLSGLLKCAWMGMGMGMLLTGGSVLVRAVTYLSTLIYAEGEMMCWNLGMTRKGNPTYYLLLCVYSVQVYTCNQ